jgi:hypothetical protein
MYHRRQYPEINPGKFQKSAESILDLIPQANRLIKKIKQSPSLAKKIQGNAQAGKAGEVEKLLKKAGINSDMKVTYTPDQIAIHIYNQSGSITFELPW